MFKTFKVWKSTDNTWTGGGIPTNDKYLEQMDELINKYAKENKLKVSKVEYSIVNENIQHGSESFNVERRVYFFAGVSFTKRWF